MSMDSLLLLYEAVGLFRVSVTWKNNLNIQAQWPRPRDNASFAMGGMVLLLLGQSTLREGPLH